jgi:hypothetical protein
MHQFSDVDMFGLYILTKTAFSAANGVGNLSTTTETKVTLSRMHSLEVLTNPLGRAKSALQTSMQKKTLESFPRMASTQNLTGGLILHMAVACRLAETADRDPLPMQNLLSSSHLHYC